MFDGSEDFQRVEKPKPLNQLYCLEATLLLTSSIHGFDGAHDCYYDYHFLRVPSRISSGTNNRAQFYKKRVDFLQHAS